MQVTASLYFQNLWDDGNRCIDDLSPEELSKLVGYLMRDCPKDMRHEYVTETVHFDDALLDLADYFTHDSPMKLFVFKDNVFSSLVKSAIKHSRKAIEGMFASYTERSNENEKEARD